MKFTSYAAMAALISFSSATAAHNALPNLTWCLSGRVVPMGSFAFSADAIATYAACLRSGNCIDGVVTPVQLAGQRGGGGGGCTTTSCGEFDDDYGVAQRLAHHYCVQYARPWQPGHVADWGSVVADVRLPANFNAATHHMSYSGASGLSGVCARCEDPYIRPPTD